MGLVLLEFSRSAVHSLGLIVIRALADVDGVSSDVSQSATDYLYCQYSISESFTRKKRFSSRND